mgnify:CR=1 FL=1
MFQNDYRREMDGLRPSPAAVERLNRLLEEGAPARRSRRLGRRAAAALGLCLALLGAATPALAANAVTAFRTRSDSLVTCVAESGWGVASIENAERTAFSSSTAT